MKKMDLNGFKIKGNIVHNSTYDYSYVEYVGIKDKIKIRCISHGLFEQTPDSHLHGHGCPLCASANNKSNFTKLINKFIIEGNIVHNNKYDYSGSIYSGSRKKIEINCNKHGIFKQTPDSHLHGRGCPKCVNRNKTTNEFIERANVVHDNIYCYENVCYVNPKIKIDIICQKHGVFKQTPNSHLSGRGCPICSISKGESIIQKYLKANKIEYVMEKKFDGCRNKYCLPFDFYLLLHNILIEYDGEHHVRPIQFQDITIENAELNFKNTLVNDEIKNNYCKINNIRLLRIPHTVLNIEEFLKNNLK